MSLDVLHISSWEITWSKILAMDINKYRLVEIRKLELGKWLGVWITNIRRMSFLLIIFCYLLPFHFLHGELFFFLQFYCMPNLVFSKVEIFCKKTKQQQQQKLRMKDKDSKIGFLVCWPWKVSEALFLPTEIMHPHWLVRIL
jgi:hypothetical protein